MVIWSWIMSWSAGKLLTIAVDNLNVKSINKKLGDGVNTWAKSQIPKLDYPDPLFTWYDSSENTNARLKLSKSISSEEIPDISMWEDALMESYISVRDRLGDNCHEFFKQKKEEISDSIINLASILHGICLNEEKFFKKAVIYSNEELRKKTGDILDVVNENSHDIKKMKSQLDEMIVMNIEKQQRVKTDTLNNLFNLGSDEVTTNLVFAYKLKALTIDRPSLVLNGSLRVNRVEKLIGYLKDKNWISLQGINGSGKTQLASLVCSKFKNSFWLDLRPFSEDIDKIHLLLGTFLSQISGVDIFDNRVSWLKEVIDALPNETLIILNDLPEQGKNVGFDELIIKLSISTINTSVRLLTTSNYRISELTKEKIDNEKYEEYYELEFDDEELKEYLDKNGAPNTVISYSNLISSVTHRNPRLISAVIRSLKDINWGNDSKDIFDVLIKKKFGNKVLENVQKSIKELIKDPDSKELLYRLSLFDWTFNTDHLIAVAEVDKPVQYPLEKLSELENIWIQKVSESSYQISPLINQIGKKNLTRKVIREVNISVAKTIMHQGKIDQINTSRIISLLLDAEEVNQAGSILVNFYQSAQSVQEAQIISEWGYLMFWSSTPFPKEMNLFLRAHIIYEQIRLKSLIGKSTSQSFSNLELILSEKDITKEVEFVVRVFCLSGYHNEVLPHFSEYLKSVFNDFNEVEEPFRELLTEELVNGLLWVLMQQISKYTELQIWLELIEIGERKLEFDFFDNEMAQTAIAVLSSRILKNEKFYDAEGKVSNISILEGLREFFHGKNKEILEATVLKELIAQKFIQDKVGQADSIKITEEAIETFESNIAQYLMNENLGKLLKDTDDKENSERYLRKALGYNCTSQSTYIDTLIYYASVISHKEPEKAVESCYKATKIASQREDYNELDYIQINAELGLAYWLNSNLIQSFESFELVVENLFKLRNEQNLDENWVRLFKWVGHALGYISADTREVDLPQKTRSDEEYVKPYQGFFSFNNKNLTDLYHSNEDPILLVHMAYFAEGVDRIEGAYIWSQKAFELSRRIEDSKTFFMVSSICSQFLLLNYKVSETIESVLLFSAITSHLKSHSAEEKHKELEGINIPDILGEKPSEKWNVAEENTISFALIPLFIMALTSKSDNSNGNKPKLLLEGIRNYIPKASSSIDWETILEISSKVFREEISIKELIDRGNTFSQNGKQNMHLICILGIVYISEDDDQVAKQLLNVTPYLTKTQSIRESSIRYILFPFIKRTVVRSIKRAFVGSRAELNELISQIDDINRRDSNCIQLMIQPLIKELEVKIPDDRKRWLYEFEVI